MRWPGIFLWTRTAARPPSVLLPSRRRVFQETQTWGEWSADTRADLERYWFPRLAEVDRRANERPDQAAEKAYVLSMFPYPSGRLHMGHLRVYTVTDVLARWQRLRGKWVVQPMGWDAFGLPAENAAMERGREPQEWTRENIAAMKSQLKEMALSLDWSRELSTCDPAYYRWTQWLFLQLHRHGLTYQRRALVNWDPVDKTVLADELVDEQGRSWRSGARVERRKLRQWFFRTTAYSQSLLDGLREVDGNQWRDVVRRQRGWIGRLTGTTVEFDVRDSAGRLLQDRLHVFTDNPRSILHTAFVLISPENMLADGQSQADLTPLPLVAVHPLTGQSLPVLLSPCLAFRHEESLDARLGVPADSAEDLATARRLSLPAPAGAGEVDGREVMRRLREAGRGGHAVSPLRTDWLISRQRLWGTPIPMVHCRACGAVPVPEDDLPVLLPRGTARPLAEEEEWQRTACPRCGETARRETDTMDTFVDSSWYFLRFLDPHNADAAFDTAAARRLMPVDIYVGGIEHAIRHLFYARFVAHFLHDLGLLAQREPFVRFLPVGLVMGRTFRAPSTGRYLAPGAVRREGDGWVAADSGEAVEESWDKMSKSKHNGTDPRDVMRRLGVDATRLCMMANTGPHRGRRWEEDAVLQGVINWQRRVWRLVGDALTLAEGGPLPPAVHPDPLQSDAKFVATRSRCLTRVSQCFDESFVISSGIAALQNLTDLLLKVPPESRRDSQLFADSLCDLVVCMSPLAPMFASELWSGVQHLLASRPASRYDLSRPVQCQRFEWPQ